MVLLCDGTHYNCSIEVVLGTILGTKESCPFCTRGLNGSNRGGGGGDDDGLFPRLG